MEIISYVKFTEPGEKDKLEQLVKESQSNLELRSKIIKTFKVNSIDAGTIASRAKHMFNNQKQ